MINLHLIIRGKVQGVFFRKETFLVAAALGVNGYVENRDDESVFVVAEGEKDAVFKLVDYVHHGPENAVVEHVSIIEGEIKNFQSFEIRRK